MRIIELIIDYILYGLFFILTIGITIPILYVAVQLIIAVFGLTYDNFTGGTTYFDYWTSHP